MSKAYELEGTIKVIGATQEFNSGFTKREIVVTVPDGEYPQDVKLEVVKDKCAELDQFAVGQEVSVSFNLRGNEYNDKYYVNLQAWKVTATSPAPQSAQFDGEEIPF